VHCFKYNKNVHTVNYTQTIVKKWNKILLFKDNCITNYCNKTKNYYEILVMRLNSI